MNRVLRGLALATILIAPHALAQSARSVYTPGPQMAQPGATLFDSAYLGPTSPGSTGAQTVFSYSLPAWTAASSVGGFTTLGNHIIVIGDFNKAANGDTITASIAFGSETCSTGTITGSGQVSHLELDIQKSGSSTQEVVCRGTTGTSVITGTITAATETDTSAITIKAVCNSVTTDTDCVASVFTVRLFP